jgi:excisionase family DNA binding protein
VSNQNDDYISFEKALRDLQMQSEQLKRLVSEGEIRAFRDGDSMKFKREDLDALRGDGDDEAEELVFEESLEDDTGMVTEELSDEDTLLAEDDLDDEPEPVAAAPAPRAQRAPATAPRARSARARVDGDDAEEGTPTWVTAGLILTTVLMFYAVTIMFTVSSSALPPGGSPTELGAAVDPFGIFEPPASK